MNVAGTAAIAHTSSSTATWATMADIRMDGESTAVVVVGFHHGQCQWRSLAIQRGHSRGHVHPIQLHILIVQVERLSCCCRGLEIVIVRDIVLWLVLVVVDLVVEWLLELMVLILLLMLAQQYVVFAS